MMNGTRVETVDEAEEYDLNEDWTSQKPPSTSWRSSHLQPYSQLQPRSQPQVQPQHPSQAQTASQALTQTQVEPQGQSQSQSHFMPASGSVDQAIDSFNEELQNVTKSIDGLLSPSNRSRAAIGNGTGGSNMRQSPYRPTTHAHTPSHVHAHTPANRSSRRAAGSTPAGRSASTTTTTAIDPPPQGTPTSRRLYNTPASSSRVPTEAPPTPVQTPVIHGPPNQQRVSSHLDDIPEEIDTRDSNVLTASQKRTWSTALDAMERILREQNQEIEQLRQENIELHQQLREANGSRQQPQSQLQSQSRPRRRQQRQDQQYGQSMVNQTPSHSALQYDRSHQGMNGGSGFDEHQSQRQAGTTMVSPTPRGLRSPNPHSASRSRSHSHSHSYAYSQSQNHSNHDHERSRMPAIASPSLNTPQGGYLSRNGTNRSQADDPFSPGTCFVAELARLTKLEEGHHAPLSVILDKHWGKLRRHFEREDL